MFAMSCTVRVEIDRASQRAVATLQPGEAFRGFELRLIREPNRLHLAVAPMLRPPPSRIGRRAASTNAAGNCNEVP